MKKLNISLVMSLMCLLSEFSHANLAYGRYSEAMRVNKHPAVADRITAQPYWHAGEPASLAGRKAVGVRGYERGMVRVNEKPMVKLRAAQHGPDRLRQAK